MMSASEGGGGSWKSGHSKGGCVNFILQISSKCRQGGEGVKKAEKFADVIHGSPLTLPFRDHHRTGLAVVRSLFTK